MPALILTLFLSSMVAFVCSRFSAGGSTSSLLLVFTAGNLLPQQVIIQPLFQMYNRIPDAVGLLSNSRQPAQRLTGVILIHVAFQIGFCTFVLSNYMKTIPAS